MLIYLLQRRKETSMPNFQHHVFVCTNQRPAENPRGCCDAEGLGSLQIQWKRELAARGLKGEVRANRAGCLDQCEHGPTVVIYPEGVWYGRVTPADIPEIIEQHLVGGTPLARLQLDPSCINTPSCPHRPRPEGEGIQTP
jgi:(2Fe-2S) ferredoxin